MFSHYSSILIDIRDGETKSFVGVILHCAHLHTYTHTHPQAYNSSLLSLLHSNIIYLARMVIHKTHMNAVSQCPIFHSRSCLPIFFTYCIALQIPCTRSV